MMKTTKFAIPLICLLVSASSVRLGAYQVLTKDVSLLQVAERIGPSGQPIGWIDEKSILTFVESKDSQYGLGRIDLNTNHEEVFRSLNRQIDQKKHWIDSSEIALSQSGKWALWTGEKAAIAATDGSQLHLTPIGFRFGGCGNAGPRCNDIRWSPSGDTWFELGHKERTNDCDLLIERNVGERRVSRRVRLAQECQQEEINSSLCSALSTQSGFIGLNIDEGRLTVTTFRLGRNLQIADKRTLPRPLPIEYESDAVISSSGDRIAWFHREGIKTETKMWLYVTDLHTGEFVRIGYVPFVCYSQVSGEPPDESPVSDPRWSKDGKRICFTYEGILYVMDLNVMLH
jgi:hypothetical protein